MSIAPAHAWCPIDLRINQALAAYLEMEEELCTEEARSIVAETMAPFENQLVELQREKDFAAMQVGKSTPARA